MTKNLKKLFIVLAIIAGIAVIFLLYQRVGTARTTGGLVSSTGESPLVTPGDVNSSEVVALGRTEELVALLSRVSQITLDTSVIDSPAFASLVDVSIQLPIDPRPGRVNPFEPIGSELRTPQITTADNQVTVL